MFSEVTPDLHVRVRPCLLTSKELHDKAGTKQNRRIALFCRAAMRVQHFLPPQLNKIGAREHADDSSLHSELVPTSHQRQKLTRTLIVEHPVIHEAGTIRRSHRTQDCARMRLRDVL